METSAPGGDGFSRVTVVALGILWLLFLSIVTYVEIDTRRALYDAQARLWVLEQKVIAIDIRQQTVLSILGTMEPRVREIERQWWRQDNRGMSREE
jgi:hypothetical protein